MSWICEDCHREPCICDDIEKIDSIKKDRDTYRDLLYRLVIKKDGTARVEAEALLKGDSK